MTGTTLVNKEDAGDAGDRERLASPAGNQTRA